jgi:ethanolamine ammonia-lyase small subunit
MSLLRLRDFTPARVALGRAGASLPTNELLAFQLAHAQARDAVAAALDPHALAARLPPSFPACLLARSAAPDRSIYLRHPDLGRRLADESQLLLSAHRGSFDVAFVIADGLSAIAVERHAPPLLAAIADLLAPREWRIAPPVIIEQGRVAIGDQVAACLGASLVVVLIGERPGLSSPDSLGIYLTWNPRPGLADADRNCISNVRAEGLSYAAAAHRLLFLMTQARVRRLSGVLLREEEPAK